MADTKGLPAVHSWLEDAVQHRPQKRWGQHFLTNRGVLQRILDAAELTPDDDVIEVGPGRGILTRELVEHASRVLAIEVDRALVQRLQAEFAGHDNLSVLQGDILDYSPERLLTFFPNAATRPPTSYLVVANLPYNIAAPTLRLFLDSTQPPKRLVVMVQYEVAQSIVAKPGDMSILSVAIQYFGSPKLIAKVPPGSFTPSPKIDSAVIRIDTYAFPPIDVPSTQAFFQTVRAGFSAPRKQLRNALSQGLGTSPEDALELLTSASIDPTRRAQTLSLEEWGQLTRARTESAPQPR